MKILLEFRVLVCRVLSQRTAILSHSTILKPKFSSCTSKQQDRPQEPRRSSTTAVAAVIKEGNSGDFSLLVEQYLPIFLACGEHRRGGFAK